MPVSLPLYNDAMAKAMLEATLQSNILGAADTLAWLSYHTHDSRRSRRGFPDLCMAHRDQHRLIFAELKRETENLRPEQKLWANILRSLPFVEYYLWRPSDWLSGDVTRIPAARPT